MVMLWQSYELLGYADADGSMNKDQQAISGYTFMVNGGAVSWSAKWQELISLSTTESEYVAVTHAAKEALWLLSEDTFAHQSLRRNISILTLWTHSASPTLRTSLHINVKLHFPQVALSMPPSVSTPKNRWKCTPSYPASKSESCHCCMYYHCVASLFYFPLFFYPILLGPPAR